MRQLIKRSGGWQLANETVELPVAQFDFASINWPDYQEHDSTKECVLLKKVEVEIDPAALITAMAAVSETMSLCLAFRSGNYGPSTADLDWGGSTLTMQKFIFKGIWYRHAVAAAAADEGPIHGELDFSDDPIVVNPVVNTVGLFLMSVDGTTVFAADYVMYRLWYKWQTAKQADLQAYLGWEAQG